MAPPGVHPTERESVHLTERESIEIERVIGHHAYPLVGGVHDLDPLMNLIGDARVVLLGEASHGTHEFYHMRAEITKRLIRERQFTAVCAEADWPDANRANNFVQGDERDVSAEQALGDFQRFPAWMWRNADVLDFIGWLRDYNEETRTASKAGFYGLDLYSMYASIQEVIRYLESVDPAAAERARQRYSCLEEFVDEPQRYGYWTSLGVTESCEQKMVQELLELHARRLDLIRRDGREKELAEFYAEQNARVARNAETYYRAMFGSNEESWNIRDTHMAETLSELLRFLDRRAGQTKAVVWAHNSHLGDARATDMSRRGEINLGQLLRQTYGETCVAIGFTTHHGTVTAASNWDSPAERKRVRPGLPGSYEALFHAAPLQNFLLPMHAPRSADTEWHNGWDKLRTILGARRLERAIGVIYRPETERASHYFYADLPGQFDAVIHFDETRAVEPLELTALWHAGPRERAPAEPPETYPSGL